MTQSELDLSIERRVVSLMEEEGIVQRSSEQMDFAAKIILTCGQGMEKGEFLTVGGQLTKAAHFGEVERVKILASALPIGQENPGNLRILTRAMFEVYRRSAVEKAQEVARLLGERLPAQRAEHLETLEFAGATVAGLLADIGHCVSWQRVRNLFEETDGQSAEE